LQILNNQERQSVPGVKRSKAFNALRKVSWTRSSALEKSPASDSANARTEGICGKATVSKEWLGSGSSLRGSWASPASLKWFMASFPLTGLAAGIETSAESVPNMDISSQADTEVLDL
jgi:hypothetical protein